MSLTVICAPADFPNTVRGSTFDRLCSKCSGRVMLAPSGQKMMEQHPNADILCFYCFLLGEVPGEPVGLTAATIDELRAEIASTVPNTWRMRN